MTKENRVFDLKDRLIAFAVRLIRLSCRVLAKKQSGEPQCRPTHLLMGGKGERRGEGLCRIIGFEHASKHPCLLPGYGYRFDSRFDSRKVGLGAVHLDFSVKS